MAAVAASHADVEGFAPVVHPAKNGDPFTCKVDSISIAGGTAVVTLTEQDYLGYDYATSLHLLRDETGAWSIVSTLLDGTPTKPS